MNTQFRLGLTQASRRWNFQSAYNKRSHINTRSLTQVNHKLIAGSAAGHAARIQRVVAAWVIQVKEGGVAEMASLLQMPEHAIAFAMHIDSNLTSLGSVVGLVLRTQHAIGNISQMIAESV